MIVTRCSATNRPIILKRVTPSPMMAQHVRSCIQQTICNNHNPHPHQLPKTFTTAPELFFKEPQMLGGCYDEKKDVSDNYHTAAAPLLYHPQLNNQGHTGTKTVTLPTTTNSLLKVTMTALPPSTIPFVTAMTLVRRHNPYSMSSDDDVVLQLNPKRIINKANPEPTPQLRYQLLHYSNVVPRAIVKRTLFGKHCVTRLGHLIRIKLGGVCGDMSPQAVASVVYQACGVVPAGVDMFTRNMGRCCIWLHREEDVAMIIQALSQKVWMGTPSIGFAVLATSQHRADFMADYLTRFPCHHTAYPRHLVTVDRWIEKTIPLQPTNNNVQSFMSVQPKNKILADDVPPPEEHMSCEDEDCAAEDEHDLPETVQPSSNNWTPMAAPFRSAPTYYHHPQGGKRDDAPAFYSGYQSPTANKYGYDFYDVGVKGVVTTMTSGGGPPTYSKASSLMGMHVHNSFSSVEQNDIAT